MNCYVDYFILIFQFFAAASHHSKIYEILLLKILWGIN